MNLWLIEVNLSPACSARKIWLTEMLESMTDQALDKVEDRILKIGHNLDTAHIRA